MLMRRARCPRADGCADPRFVAVQRREMDVRAFGLQHDRAFFAPLQHGDAEASARADHRDRAPLRQRRFGSEQVRQIARLQRVRRMRHRAEIVEQQRALQPELALQAGRINHPVRIDKAHRTPSDWPGKPESGEARQGLCQHRAERPPCLSQPRMVLRAEHHRLAQRAHGAACHFGNGEAGIGAANVSDGYAHACCTRFCLPE